MKRLFFLFFCFVPLVIFSQVKEHQSVKTSVENGRFEIIQSEIARKLTLMLDKYTGTVFQFVKTSNDEFSWQKIDCYDLPNEVEPNKINYQLFLGGIVLADCILLNIHSGYTWMLYEDKKTHTYYFAPFY